MERGDYNLHCLVSPAQLSRPPPLPNRGSLCDGTEKKNTDRQNWLLPCPNAVACSCQPHKYYIIHNTNKMAQVSIVLLPGRSLYLHEALSYPEKVSKLDYLVLLLRVPSKKEKTTLRSCCRTSIRCFPPH